MGPHRLSGQYSPFRDKRRQSDAKWRASVATCYDALKYVIPNVKNLTRKKISKALILQECEKHIQDLEETISFLFHVECKNQGQVGLWKEGHQWTRCSMEKLRADFSEKQRKVFTSSARGRRCYNLLRDIKEDVFNMTADSKQMTFIREDSLELVSASENLSGSSAVSVFQLPAENFRSIALSEEATGDISRGICNKEDFHSNKKGGDCLTYVHNSCSSSVDTIQVRQQPHPRQRLICQAESNVDSALLRGLNDSERNASTNTLTPSCESVYLLSAESCENEEKLQNVHCVASPGTSSSAPEVSSSTHISIAVNDISEETSSTVYSHDGGESCKLNCENLNDGIFILSNERGYTCLLRALEIEKDQEVPSLETGIKTTRIKRPRLTNFGSDTDCHTNYTVTCGSNRKDSSCFRQDALEENLYTAQNNTGCVSHTGRSKISTLESRPSSLSSLIYLNVPDIKMEADKSVSCSSHDPTLSALNMPKFDLDMPLFSLTESNGLIKQQPKYRSARKKLNFNCPSFSGWSHNSPRMLTPDKTTQRSSMPTGFTPVKLPDDVTFSSDQDNPPESLISPWKALDSPFNLRIVHQGYIDSSAMVDLEEDSLLCQETIDAVEFVGGLGIEVTPLPTHHSEKCEKPEELQKTKGSSVLAESETRMMPKCRRRLERFYDQETPSNDHVSLSDDSHVVPQSDIIFWTSTSPHCQSQPSSTPTFDLEESLVCLETLDTIDEDDCIDN